MIKIFGKTDTLFETNGDMVVKPLKANVHKEDNGDFYLEIETGLDYIDYFENGNIIVAPTPQGEQAFRITSPQMTKNKISVKAWHVFYDSKNYLIADSYVVDKNCNAALEHLNSATEPESEFTTVSDIGTVDSFRCVRKSLYEAVQTVLERWGGHLVRDNFQIGIRSEVGNDNGVVVRYRKNLKEITCTEDWDSVVTKLMPVGKDGLLLPEGYISSDRQYDLPYTKTVSFTQSEIEKDDYETEEDYNAALEEDLRLQAQLYLEENCYPKVNYTLKANLEKITDIGDTVQVIDSRLGLSLTTNVISYDYDCILGKYTEVEFGNFKKTLSNLISQVTQSAEKSIEEKAEAVKVTLGEELKEATDKIWQALGDSYVIYDGDKILIVDKLPKEIATNVIMINSAGIGFSQTGIDGTFNSAWTIDGTMDMQQINVINLTADMIKSGTLKLGGRENGNGILELYDESNAMIGEMNKNGLKMYGSDKSYVLLNNEVGFAGYDNAGNKIYWASKDEFHMKKSVVEEEITLCSKVRFIPITVTSGSTIVNNGIGLIPNPSGGE